MMDPILDKREKTPWTGQHFSWTSFSINPTAGSMNLGGPVSTQTLGEHAHQRTRRTRSGDRAAC